MILIFHFLDCFVPQLHPNYSRLLQTAAAIWLANSHGTLAQCLIIRNLLTGLSKASTRLQDCSLMVAVKLPCVPVFLKRFKAVPQDNQDMDRHDYFYCVWHVQNKQFVATLPTKQAGISLRFLPAVWCCVRRHSGCNLMSTTCSRMICLGCECIASGRIFSLLVILTFPVHLSVCSEGTARCISRIGKWIVAWVRMALAVALQPKLQLQYLVKGKHSAKKISINLKQAGGQQTSWRSCHPRVYYSRSNYMPVLLVKCNCTVFQHMGFKIHLHATFTAFTWRSSKHSNAFGSETDFACLRTLVGAEWFIQWTASGSCPGAVTGHWM